MCMACRVPKSSKGQDRASLPLNFHKWRCGFRIVGYICRVVLMILQFGRWKLFRRLESFLGMVLCNVSGIHKYNQLNLTWKGSLL